MTPTFADLMGPVLLEVNPVPWARAQMAFTLAFHIIWCRSGCRGPS